MKRFVTVILVSMVALPAATQAQPVRECSEFEQLKLDNMIDRMNDPSIYERKCIAQQEMMKAREAMTLENKDRCLLHMSNAVDVIRGRTPAGLSPVGTCAAPKKLD